ncbi:MAG: hypothetical protein Cons2KO_10820 [Congregibacter sp.]
MFVGTLTFSGMLLFGSILWALLSESDSDRALAAAAAIDGEPVEALSANHHSVIDLADLLRAAETGDADAQYKLAIKNMDRHARTGEVEDLAEANRWFQEASVQGHPRAQTALGNAYLAGRGVVQDFTQAANWFRQAAELGSSEAMYELGKMSRSGWGVEQSLVEAYVWLNLASARGETRARESRSQLISQLTGEQLAEAQARSRELDASIPFY